MHTRLIPAAIMITALRKKLENQTEIKRSTVRSTASGHSPPI